MKPVKGNVPESKSALVKYQFDLIEIFLPFSFVILNIISVIKYIIKYNLK